MLPDELSVDVHPRLLVHRGEQQPEGLGAMFVPSLGKGRICGGERLFLRDLPDPLPDSPITAIAVEVEGRPEPVTAQTSFWIPG